MSYTQRQSQALRDTSRAGTTQNGRSDPGGRVFVAERGAELWTEVPRGAEDQGTLKLSIRQLRNRCCEFVSPLNREPNSLLAQKGLAEEVILSF